MLAKQAIIVNHQDIQDLENMRVAYPDYTGGTSRAFGRREYLVIIRDNF